jgi:CHAD domain-containing protein
MTAATERDAGKEPGFCSYGARYLIRLLPAFSGEIEGVKEGAGTEPVHRMRVASRRLRAAMPLFSSCIPEKKYRAWFSEVRRTTSALGKARDLDVQIEFLIRFRDAHAKNEESPGRAGFRRPGDDGSGLDCLIGGLRAEREALQPEVRRRLDELEECRLTGEMEETLRKLVKKSGKRAGREKNLRFTAYREIVRHLEKLCSFEPWVFVEDAAEKQHRMRIAAKKLRYIMEIFAPLYAPDLGEPIRAVKRVQEQLGAIHDCDVWISTLPRFVCEEGMRPGEASPSSAGPGGPGTDLADLLEDRKRERKELYNEFVVYWKRIRLEGILDDLPLVLSRSLER